MSPFGLMDGPSFVSVPRSNVAARDRAERIEDRLELLLGNPSAITAARTERPATAQRVATGTLEYTFTQAGEILVGCHEPGHDETPARPMPVADESTRAVGAGRPRA